MKTLILWDTIEGGRGNDEYLFRLVNIPPFRLGSEGLSSAANSLALENESFDSWGLASSKACRLPSDEIWLESFELLIQLLSLRSCGERAVLELGPSLAGCTVIAGAESRTSVGGLGS